MSMSQKDLERHQKIHKKIIDDARKFRKRQVRIAKQTGTTVPYGLGQLIEDGHSLDTIRAVYRGN